VLVGDGPLAGKLQDAHPEALFVGSKTGTALAEHYASADLFLFPSLTETFGNVTLEAMASGLAVISFDRAAAHELIRDGHNGLLARGDGPAHFTAQAVRGAADPALRSKLKRHARETAVQQAWPTLMADLERLFMSLRRDTSDDALKSSV